MKKAKVEFSQFLQKGETLLWAGQPKGGIIIEKDDKPLMIAGMIFIVFMSLIMLIGFQLYSISTSVGILLVLLVLPFMLLGFYLLIGRLLIDKQNRSRTFYGLTEKRLLLKSRLPMAKIQSISITLLTEMNIVENRDGTGTISLFKLDEEDEKNSLLGGKDLDSNLVQIEDVRQIYNLIKELQYEATR